ncbi:MAG: flagellum-specific ATP synthase FliI, partial [Roseibium sp.]|nr:flagellum-specific ATP synthase FliI [Roseibium sp.]
MKALFADIDSVMPTEIYGRVTAVQGLLVEIAGPIHEMSVGSRLLIDSGEDNPRVPAEVVGFREGHALCMPFSGLEGVRMGCKAVITSRESVVHPGEAWLGRVVNALGEPIDGKGVIASGGVPRKLRSAPPPASER